MSATFECPACRRRVYVPTFESGQPPACEHSPLETADSMQMVVVD